MGWYPKPTIHHTWAIDFVHDKLWEVSDIVQLLEEHEAETTPKKRGPYKKRISEHHQDHSHIVFED